MSQGDSAPRPVSHRSSGSPARAADTTPSPPLQQSRTHQNEPRPERLRDASGFPLIRGDGTGQQQAGNRPQATRDILNPAGPHGGLPEQSPSFSHSSTAGGNQQPTMGVGQHRTGGSPPRPYSYTTPGTTTPRSTNQTLPPTTSPSGAHMPGDRGSPQAVHPYPTAARRILTPKSPRAASLSRAALRTLEAQQSTSNLQGLGARGVPLTQETQTHGHRPSPLGTPPQFYSSTPASGPAAPSPSRPTSSLSRSLSQPNLGHVFPLTSKLEGLQAGGVKREHTGQPVISGPPFAASLPTSQPFSTSGGPGESRWGSGLLSSMAAGGARRLSMSEGQPMLSITPEHGEEILVAVDIHQGSKVADQKRQRNAGASARFRQRKKEREKEQQEELQKLENENRELEKRNDDLAKRCQELESHRDFYRSERNRLRDILSRMPGGKEWADQGPPSPVMRTMAGPFAPDDGALLHHQPHPHPPPPHAHSQPPHHPTLFHHSLPHPPAQHHQPRSGSYGDPSALEPPARRRRTDSEPQLPTTSYSLMQQAPPAALPPITAPPMPPPAFGGIPPSPLVTPPGPGHARLPPLRFDPARTPSTTPPPVPIAPPPPALASQQQQPPAGSYAATPRRLPYETGWATEPRLEECGERRR